MSSGSRCLYFKCKHKSDDTQYYSYIVYYIDDILYIDEKYNEVMNQLCIYYRMKEHSVSKSNNYLAANIRKWMVQDS